jgi:nucleoside-diphosphate-sugar epimerase/DNA-binding CsgD family transcriptional regulator
VHVQTVPDIGDIVVGQARGEDIRDVDASDLLGREPVAPNLKLFDACIRNKVVMVTGAGGSIGAELCRQIARLGPRRILLFEMSELALYNIDRELRHIAAAEDRDLEITALLGSVHHKYRVREIIQSYGVQTVYHAAAYKHVPIVEENIIEGIHNNVIGTWYTAEAAHECGVEAFVLISTDKAVNPTNVMGATKRLAEMVLQGLQQRGSRTRFCMVRFGNVLESSGSVVPLFREQIHRGGPVTVTHPDVIRYFMTIPEASQLVLQASAWQAAERIPEALDALERALALAAPGGYMRVFLDEGQSMLRLLARLGHRGGAQAGHIDRLLAAGLEAGAPPPPALPSGGEAQPAGPPLVEPLSPRELEVLQLVAACASNAEIARQLVITLNTTKKHLTHIFGKLGVATRGAAVARARLLGLLPAA